MLTVKNLFYNKFKIIYQMPIYQIIPHNTIGRTLVLQTCQCLILPVLIDSYFLGIAVFIQNAMMFNMTNI